MIRAIVTQKGKPISVIVEAELDKLTSEHTKILAEAHKKELDNAIEQTRERVIKPVGDHLKDQIQVEKILQSSFSGIVNDGHGVGNIDVLNQKSPWWAWINFGRAFSGRTIPPGTDENLKIVGHFEPNVKGIFTKGQPKFPMNPKKAIQAHNYIEKALGVMVSKARELLK